MLGYILVMKILIGYTNKTSKKTKASAGVLLLF